MRLPTDAVLDRLTDAVLVLGAIAITVMIIGWFNVFKFLVLAVMWLATWSTVQARRERRRDGPDT